MFGFELPPYNSGGLGTACLGLTEELAPLGVDIDFVVPKVHGAFPFNHMRVLSAADFVPAEEIQRLLGLDESQQEAIRESLGYGGRLSLNGARGFSIEYAHGGMLPLSPHAQATWYAHQGAAVAEKKEFDVIHAHDWLTYYAAMAAKEVAKKRGEDVPYIAHIHATEFDRCGENGDPRIVAIERAGLQAADRVIAVSNYTKQVVHARYGVPLNRISVVHNGIPRTRVPKKFDLHELKKNHKIVLFMGRVTMQKGPDYFVRLAEAVIKRDPSVRFVLVGSGDMEKKCIEDAARLGLTGKMLFSSFLRGQDPVDRAYQLADLFVMPSVSEPFGLVALEAMQNGTPVIISKQSGVAEVSKSMVAVDFWDIEEMSSQVLRLLDSPALRAQLAEQGTKELAGLTSETAAQRMQEIYEQVCQSFVPARLVPAPIAIAA